MADKVQLIDLVNKNYTGDAMWFEKEISLNQISGISKTEDDLIENKNPNSPLPLGEGSGVRVIEEKSIDLTKKLTKEEFLERQATRQGFGRLG